MHGRGRAWAAPQAAFSRGVFPPFMPCCNGKRSCGGVAYRVQLDAARDTAEAIARQRWPTKLAVAHDWKKASSPAAAAQFENYDDGLRVAADDPQAPFTYAGEYLRACHFPLGGFGCGRVLLCGDGTLQDWTVVNQCRDDDGGPGDEGTQPLDCMPANFFAVSATPRGGSKQSYTLVSPQNYTNETMQLPSRMEARVSPHSARRMQSLPGIHSLSMECRYPIATVDYDIPGLPVEVSMEAMNPAIPNDPKSSCLPIALFRFTLRNTSSIDVEVDLMQAQQNFIGWDGHADCTAGSTVQWGGNVNTPFADDRRKLAGLVMSSTRVPASTPDIAGTLAIAGAATPDSDCGSESDSTGSTAKIEVIAQASSEEELFAAFAAGMTQPPSTAGATAPSPAGKSWCGAVVQTVGVAAGGSSTVDFILAWYFPNRSNVYKAQGLPPVVGNYYNNLFSSAQDVVMKVHPQAEKLRATTRKYVEILFGSTMPPSILDSAAGRLAVMRSPTMLWTEGGIVLGTEGNGCCPLNCTHVYGYTTLLERLYPQLAQDMCVSNFVRTYNQQLGGVTMRYGQGWAIDGALASCIKAYICVRQSDSSLSFLRKVWPNVKKQMDFLFDEFDDGTGVIRCAQEDTYDTYMCGANTFIGSYYVTALRSASRMAVLMGDKESATKYGSRAASAAANYEKECWHEEFGYYIAAPLSYGPSAPPCPIQPDGLKYGNRTYGGQCFVDQVCAIGLSSAAGLGHIFDPVHEAKSRNQILRYNTVGPQPTVKPIVAHFYTGDSGIIVCTNPNNVKDGNPNDWNIVSGGFESPVIAGMLIDRNTDGATIATNNIRHRYDGRNRSPWNEPECGQLYSRSMAHWNLYDQACGVTYDSTKAALSFDPRFVNTMSGGEHSFRCLFLAEGGWGQFVQSGPPDLATGSIMLSVAWGTVRLKTLTVVSKAASATATVGGKNISVSIATGGSGCITFEGAGGLTLREGSSLTIALATRNSATTSESARIAPTTSTVGVGAVVESDAIALSVGAMEEVLPTLRQRRSSNGELEEQKRAILEATVRSGGEVLRGGGPGPRLLALLGGGIGAFVLGCVCGPMLLAWLFGAEVAVSWHEQ